MLDNFIFALAFAGALGSGLVAGIFYAFSSFVMGALGRIPPEQGVNAMQSINIVVINRSFMLVFFGTAGVCLALLVGAYVWWGDLRGKLLLAGSVLYLAGCIGVTMSLWVHYLDRWTMWNTVRTLAPTASMVLFITALL
jgi:uncharacterized membrane protein